MSSYWMRKPRTIIHSPDDPCAVYRIFDKYDRVIYIGSSFTPEVRIEVHRTTTTWRHEIVRHTTEWYPNQEAAREAERAAIKAEDPDHNFYHTELGFIVNRARIEDRRRVNAEARAARAARIAAEKAAIESVGSPLSCAT